MNKKYYCKNCNGLRAHKSLFDMSVKDGDDEIGYECKTDYHVIECLGCGNISFLKIFGDNEMIADDGNGEYSYFTEENIYPQYLEYCRELDHLFYLPKEIRSIYSETISAFKAEAFILTAGGFRAIIEAVCNEQKIEGKSLDAKIDKMYKNGLLTLNESKRLHAIRFLGNDALHEIQKPKIDQLRLLLEIVNHLLENLYVQDRKISGNIDSIIDKYADFKTLLERLITKDLVGQKLLFKQVLGKSLRRIKKDDLGNFINELKTEIDGGKITYVEHSTEANEFWLTIKSEPPSEWIKI